jgi:NAD(P)H-dependent FMN reductase
MSKLHVIVGSTRPARAVEKVLPWLEARLSAHGAFEVEIIDLRDWPLPMFAEHLGTIGDIRDPTYSDLIVRRWNQKMKEADAFLIVTPEYNHSIPGVLKNAIDNVFVSFALRNKPLSAVGYSGGDSGAVRAIEHLAQIAIEAEAVPLRNTVIIPRVQDAFDDAHQPTDAMTDVALRIALDDLAWWARVLARARAEGELLPGAFRARAAQVSSGR